MKRILVANRGEIARRVIATARRMGLETVAVHSDADASSPHVYEATASYALGGNTPAETYLRIDKLLSAARATGADAVHPGYGFLSEDADFAQAVQDAGLTWIGPPPEAMRMLGNKAHAKILAAEHGVPCLPGYNGEDQSVERFRAEAEKIGYPVMVKAVAGGGGRGMRLVTAASELETALLGASSEARAGFGSGELLIERAVATPRHVEIQVFADRHGHAIHLGERDCSIQRRHQKIIEETPSPAVTPELRERMGARAAALALAAGYVGAGTVEFLLEGSEFFLMEMNTRLQVEHTITEERCDLDLVEWQIRVARGENLPLTQDQVHFRGHAIEVRLCAEDENYVPHAGRIRHFAAPAATHFERSPLRLDAFVETGAEITPHYDALLGKLIVCQPTRAEAIDAMVSALGQVEILGLPTNRGFLTECLDDVHFREGAALISFLDHHAGELRDRLHAKERAAHERYALAALYPHGGSQLACTLAAPLRLRHRDETTALAVRPIASGIELVGDKPRHLALTQRINGSTLCREGGTGACVHAVEVPSAAAAHRWHAQASSVDWWFDDVSFEPIADRDAPRAMAELKAPFNGRVVRITAQVGQKLGAGENAIVIESMKLEHDLSPHAEVRVAEVLATVGQQVSPGQILLRFAVQQEHAEDSR